MADNFNERRYYESYRAIRNKICKYDTEQFVLECLRYLQAPYANRLDYVKRQPWIVLLVIKWALADRSAFEKGKPSPTTPQVHEILQLGLDLADKVRMPDQYQHVRLFLRSMAYQQFIYQRDLKRSSFARLYFLYKDLPANHFIRNKFLDEVGIPLDQFIDLSLILAVRFISKTEHVITAEWFSTLEKTYPTTEVEKFLETISATLIVAKDRIVGRDELTKASGQQPRDQGEYFEQSPFQNFPLLKFGKDYVCVEHHLLTDAIEHFVYRRLRQNKPEKFMSYFGPVFERYVGNAAYNTMLPVATESDLANLIKEKNTKLVDYLIIEDGANVYVDAKAVEMSYQGKIAYALDDMVRWLETSVVKAIKQAHSVMRALYNAKIVEPIVKHQDKNYLIVVTYGDLRIGSGSTLADIIGKEKIEAIYAECEDCPRIELDSMYFLTIEEFDLLGQAVHEKKIGITEAIERAKKADSNPSTARFDFLQHLQGWGLGAMDIDYIRQRWDHEFCQLLDITKKP